MSSAENKAIVRRFYEEYNLPVVDELFVAGYVHHDPGLPPELQSGRESFKQIVSMFRASMPDIKITVETLLADGDCVTTRWTARGTHRGELMGIPATGKQIDMNGMSIHRVEAGKIAEAWVNFDALGMLQQLGALPAPEQPEAAQR